MEAIRLTDEARKLKNEYARQQRSRRPEKAKEYLTRYWNKKAQQIKQA